jgi:hypothetical protein
MRLAGGVILAILAAGFLNLGFHAQHGAAHGMELSLRHPVRGLMRLLSDRNWLIGNASGGVGWAFYIAALALAPISVVQSVTAGGLGLLAVLAHRLGTPLVGAERWGSVLAVGGLVLLFVTLSTNGAISHHPTTSRLLVVVVSGSVAAGIAAGVGLRRGAPGWVLALGAGTFYAISDIAAKAVLDGQVIAFLPFVLGGAGLGIVLLQLSFTRGPVMATAGLASLSNNAIPIIGGVVLFHEHLPHGAAGVARLIGFAAVVVGAVLLARQPKVVEATTETQPPPSGIDPVPHREVPHREVPHREVPHREVPLREVGHREATRP